MKNFTAAMDAHLQQSLTTLATCILLTRPVDDGEYGFTTHDRRLTIGGVIYEPAASFNPMDIASANNMDTDNTEVTAMLNSNTLTEDDLRAGKWDYSEFRIFQVNWDDLTMGDKKDRRGNLGKVTVNRQTFVAELLGLMEAYGTSIGEFTTPHCRANLGDQRCKVDMTPFTFTGTVDSAGLDLYSFTSAVLTQDDNYFAEGYVRFDSGLLEGLRYDIKSSFDTGLCITKTPLSYDATGCDFTIYRGCDKKARTCTDVFSNKVNFRGEDKLRGNDVLVQIGRTDS